MYATALVTKPLLSTSANPFCPPSQQRPISARNTNFFQDTPQLKQQRTMSAKIAGARGVSLQLSGEMNTVHERHKVQTAPGGQSHLDPLPSVAR